MVATVRHWYCECIPPWSGQTTEIVRVEQCCNHCCNLQLFDRIFNSSLLCMMSQMRRHSVQKFVACFHSAVDTRRGTCRCLMTPPC